MPIQLHIMNETGQLNNIIDKIEPAFSQAIKQINTTISLSPLSTNVRVNYNEKIPVELGISGYAPSEHDIYLSVAPINDYILTNFQQILTATLAHELHHCFRHRSVGYGSTLLEAMISEGLACHLEKMVTGKTPIYVAHLDEEVRQMLLQRAKQHWHDKNYNHSDWFFGNNELALPTWTGYGLGFSLVQQYFAQTGHTAVSSCDLPASEFMRY